MKRILGLICAGLVLPAAAQAEGLPPGPYLNTCSGAKVAGPNLVAACRDASGAEHSSALINYPRCVDAITNNDCILTCDFGLAKSASLSTSHGRC